MLLFNYCQKKKLGYEPVVIPPLPDYGSESYALEAQDLTVKFGDFTAVDHVNFKIKRGEIFGFLGSNGCGKSTTMKVLTDFRSLRRSGVAVW